MTHELRARLDGYADVHEYVAERNAAADKKVDARARQGTSKFRGVSMKKSWRSKLFQCSYYIPGPKRIQLYFKREEEAAHAYDRAQVEIHGRAAIDRLNFPLASYQAADEFTEEQLDEIDARVAAGKPPPASVTVTASKPAARKRGGAPARKSSSAAGEGSSGGGTAAEAAAAAAAAAEEEEEEEDDDEQEWDDAGYWSSDSMEELEAGGFDPPCRGSKVSPYKAYAGQHAAASGDAGSAVLAAIGGFESGDEPPEMTEEELTHMEAMRETCRDLVGTAVL
ncbi:AP2-like ethylene-responsive transcription factor TOE3 [Micractinium conductrix]|uniref:AP2-like ethylene-responsive transcription factor TOE3 n=1 Tax=Micractinium conductrix TaxID=554055 RepID=A0A2P6VKM4_9CHLO|nr:AP2-like ethylene-responsive transcription factor TOE3 [Micractinium conductrix]|eukprot:PSC74610.1 AP2-like ethylene-responsive transcription factor TOE3 [Micractinium conductrix]